MVRKMVQTSDNRKVSDLSVSEFTNIIRDIVKSEISKNLPVYSIPEYKGFEIPNELGELNQSNSETYATNYTVFRPQEFPGWGYGYHEKNK